MSGTFRSAKQTFQVQGDWIPAGDQGSDLLGFFGHPFGPTSPMGLVGLATLTNTCTPSCVASHQYKLTETSVSPQLSTKLPGVGKPTLLVHLHS
jgi:AhpD family alkylhydroperoxidase